MLPRPECPVERPSPGESCCDPATGAQPRPPSQTAREGTGPGATGRIVARRKSVCRVDLCGQLCDKGSAGPPILSAAPVGVEVGGPRTRDAEGGGPWHGSCLTTTTT